MGATMGAALPAIITISATTGPVAWGCIGAAAAVGTACAVGAAIATKDD